MAFTSSKIYISYKIYPMPNVAVRTAPGDSVHSFALVVRKRSDSVVVGRSLVAIKDADLA